jgi:hypothetical protein
MGHMIDVKAVPVPVLVTSFLSAMAKNQAEAAVVFQYSGKQAVATNKSTAEAMARTYFAVKDGALEVAAIALHAWRMVPEKTASENVDNPAGLCSIVLCAGHELSVGGGNAVPWDELPEPIREAHRLAAKVAIAAAVAHQPAKEASQIVKPT